jgi:hypothetical protein
VDGRPLASQRGDRTVFILGPLAVCRAAAGGSRVCWEMCCGPDSWGFGTGHLWMVLTTPHPALVRLFRVRGARMKFGKSLQKVISFSPDEWAPFFINYKLLKKQIKGIAGSSPPPAVAASGVRGGMQTPAELIQDAREVRNRDDWGLIRGGALPRTSSASPPSHMPPPPNLPSMHGTWQRAWCKSVPGRVPSRVTHIHQWPVGALRARGASGSTTTTADLCLWPQRL